MGLSHAVSAAVLLVGASFAGFELSDRAFDAQDALAVAWEDASELDLHRARTAFQVTDVRGFGAARTEVTVQNTGATVLDASAVTLLFGGVPVVVSGWAVDGAGSDVWAPGTELVLDGPGASPSPTDVLVVDRHGVTATWRA